MPEPTNTYDAADDITLNFGGVPLESGWATGIFIKVEYDSPAYVDEVGADGSVIRSRTYDDRATVTVTFMQKARANTVLSALHEDDKSQPNGRGIRPLLIRDKAGTALHFGSKAWISEPPVIDYNSPGSSPKEWKFRVAKLTRNDGGAVDPVP